MQNYSNIKNRHQLYWIYTAISISTLVFYIVLFFALGAPGATHSLFVFVVLFIFAYYLYNSGKKALAILISGMSSVAVVTLHTVLYFGREAGFHYQFFALIVVLYLVSDFNENGQRFASVFGSVAAIAAFIICDITEHKGILDAVANGVPSIVRYSSMFVTGFTAIIMLYYYTIQLSKKESELYYLANNDHLTGIFNRGYYEIQGNKIFEEYSKKGTKFSVILMDIDDFKKINDTYGHSAGDLVLKNFSRLIQSMLAKNAIFARYGGEEFVVLCTGCNLEDTYRLAEEIRQSIAAMTVDFQGLQLNLTASFGVASISKNHENFDQLMIKADKLLYTAKAEGKNKVTK